MDSGGGVTGSKCGFFFQWTVSLLFVAVVTQSSPPPTVHQHRYVRHTSEETKKSEKGEQRTEQTVFADTSVRGKQLFLLCR